MTGASQERRLARIAEARASQAAHRTRTSRGAPPASKLDEELAVMLEQINRGGKLPPPPPECHDTHRASSRCGRCRQWRAEVDTWLDAHIAASPEDDSGLIDGFVLVSRAFGWVSSISEASLVRLVPYLERSLAMVSSPKY